MHFLTEFPEKENGYYGNQYSQKCGKKICLFYNVN